MSGCKETRDLLSPYLEGELTPEERAGVESHLGECEDCRIDLDLLRRTVVALKGLPDLPPPAGILHGVRERMEPVPWHRRLFGRGRSPFRAGIPLGAAATVLVAFGIFLLTERYPDLSKPPADLSVPPAPVRTTVPPPREEPGTAKEAPVAEIRSAERAEEAAAVPEPPAAVSPKPPPEKKLEAEAVSPAPMVPSMTEEKGSPSPVSRVDRDTVSPPPPPRTKADALTAAAKPAGPAPVSAPARGERNAGMPADELLEPVPSPAPPSATFAEKAARPPIGESKSETMGFADDRATPGGPLGQEIPSPPPYEAEREALPPTPSPSRAREGRPSAPLRKAAPPAGEGSFYKSLLPTDGKDALRASGAAETGQRIETSEEFARGPSPQGTTEVLTIVSLDGDEMSQLRETLKQSGGRILEMQTLDAYSSQQVALPFRDRIAPSQVISRGWQIRAVVPAEKVEDFVSSLEQGKRMQLLHRKTEPPLWPADPGVQNIQINLVR